MNVEDGRVGRLSARRFHVPAFDFYAIDAGPVQALAFGQGHPRQDLGIQRRQLPRIARGQVHQPQVGRAVQAGPRV